MQFVRKNAIIYKRIRTETGKMHEGHRQRIIEKLSANERLEDHELLEILLFNAIPRKNTNDIAHNLLDAYGSLVNVLHADMESLMGVEGIGRSTAAYLATVGLIYTRIGERRMQEVPQLVFSFSAFRDYVIDRYRGLTVEVVDIFSLDARNRLSYGITFTTGESDRASFSAEKVTQLLASQRPSGIVISHNHPNSPPDPSIQDDDFTKRMHLLCALSGVKLYEHVIVGTTGAFSYYISGRLEAIRRDLDVDTLVCHPIVEKNDW